VLEFIKYKNPENFIKKCYFVNSSCSHALNLPC
jgi:hypothetical protein